MEQTANHVGQNLLETGTHSFVVKIWLEETAEASRATWRGHITHVPGGERRHIQDLDSVSAFIAPYLKAMGVEVRLHRG